MQRICILMLGVLFVASSAAHADEGQSIKELLLGNSIKNPAFGCIFYRDEETAESFFNGIDQSYPWSVVGNRYVSGSRCGSSGCKIITNGNQVTFEAIESDYSMTVQLFKGNQCNQEVISSLDNQLSKSLATRK